MLMWIFGISSWPESGVNSAVAKWGATGLILYLTHRFYKRYIQNAKGKLLAVEFVPVNQGEMTTVPSGRLRSKSSGRLRSKSSCVYDDFNAKYWSDFLELDPLFCSEHNCCSLKEYFQSLQIDDSFNLDKRQIVLEAIHAFGLDALLPLIGMMGGGESLLTEKVQEAGRVCMQYALSPSALEVLNVLFHKISRLLPQPDRYNPIDSLHDGWSGFEECFSDDNWFTKLTSDLDEVILPDGLTQVLLPRLVAKVSEKEASACSTASMPCSERFLPRLHGGVARQEHRRNLSSPQEAALSYVFPVLLNRLIASQFFVTRRFQVRFKDTGVVATDVDSFIRVLAESAEDFQIHMYTLLTSFSNAYSVKYGKDDWRDVPLILPIRTGLSALSGEEIVCPMSHGGIQLRMRCTKYLGPDTCVVDCYQMVNSFTGWQSSVWTNWPWHQDDLRVYASADWNSSLDRKLQAIRCCTMLSVLTNSMVKTRAFVNGGYGYTGTCTDFTATVEAAMCCAAGQEPITSIFPLIQSGQAKIDLLREAVLLQGNDSANVRASAMHQTNLEVLAWVMKAISNTPSDIDIPPCMVKDACRRIDLTLPVESPFKLVKAARAQVQALAASSMFN